MPGLDYGLDNGSFVTQHGLHFTIDANGQVGNINIPAAAHASGNTIFLNTTPIVVDPGVYSGAYFLSIYNQRGFFGRQSFLVIPGLPDQLDGGDFVGPFQTQYALTFGVDQNGQVGDISNSAAAQSIGSTLLLSCAGVHIDPTTYSGGYRVGLVFGLSGQSDLNLIAGLSKTLFGLYGTTLLGTFTPDLAGVVPSSLSTTSGSQAYDFQFTAQSCVSPTRSIAVSPSSINFGSQLTGTASSSQTITLTNTGSAAFTITRIRVGGSNPGDFTQVSSSCGSSLNASLSCSLSITFTPSAAGSRNASVTISDSASNGLQIVTLTGTGTALPTVTLSAVGLAFADQNVGTTSPPQNITVTNTGNATLAIVSIKVGGTNQTDFAQTNTCGSSINAGASCTVTVNFTPTATGNRTGTLTLMDNASGSPQVIALAGNGINTPTGTNIVSTPVDATTGSTPVSLTFSTVTQAGTTSLITGTTGNSPPSGFNLGNPPTYYQLSTTAAFSGSISICINYAGVSFTTPSELRLFHFEGGAWMDVTTSLDITNSIICGSVTSLSPFAVFQSAYSAAVQPPISLSGRNVFNAQRGVVPVKFSLALNGAPTCQLPAATIAVFRTSGTSTQLNQADFIMPSDNGLSFRIDRTNCQYIYNLGSSELGPGSYLVQIKISNVAVGSAKFGLQ